MVRKGFNLIHFVDSQSLALLLCVGFFSFLYLALFGLAQDSGSGTLTENLQTTPLAVVGETSSDTVVDNNLATGSTSSETTTVPSSGTNPELILSGTVLSGENLLSGADASSGNVDVLTGQSSGVNLSGEILYSGSSDSGTELLSDTGLLHTGIFLTGTENLHPVALPTGDNTVGGDASGEQSLDSGIGMLSGSSIEFMQPRELMQYVQRGLIVGSGTSNAVFLYDFVYRNFDDSVRVTLASGLVVSTYSGESFDLPSFGIYDSSDYSGSFEQLDSGKSPNDGKEGFGFGVSHQRLVFSKPVRIEYATEQEDGIQVEISVKHSGDLEYGTGGLGTIDNNECLTGGEILYPHNIVRVKNGKITFYTCGASSFALTYTGGATITNYVDNGSNTKTVTFLTGTHLPTGAQISDVNLTLSFRPIDSENPASFGTTNCYPTEKSFQLIAPDGTTVQIINPGQLTTPNTSCPTSTITFDQQAGTALGNNYNVVGSYRPFGNLSTLNGKSPFGVWTLRMTDNALYDGVILFGFTVSINATDPYICIGTPATFTTGIVSSGSSQIINYLFDYFSVDDQKGINSGYYTTLSMTNLSGTNGTIPNSLIRRKADPLVLLSGTANTGVQLGGAISTGYIAANTTVTHIYRNAGTNNFVKSNYGSKLNLQITIPGYSPVGLYTGTITYTLYEN